MGPAPTTSEAVKNTPTNGTTIVYAGLSVFDLPAEKRAEVDRGVYSGDLGEDRIGNRKAHRRPGFGVGVVEVPGSPSEEDRDDAEA
jgi:hypothetical protein